MSTTQVQINQGLILGSVGVGLGAISFLYVIAKAAITKYISKKVVAEKVVDEKDVIVDVQFKNMATLHIDAADLDDVQKMLKLMKTQHAIATTTSLDTQG